jgi:MoxR-like ATPase
MAFVDRVAAAAGTQWKPRLTQDAAVPPRLSVPTVKDIQRWAASGKPGGTIFDKDGQRWDVVLGPQRANAIFTCPGKEDFNYPIDHLDDLLTKPDPARPWFSVEGIKAISAWRVRGADSDMSIRDKFGDRWLVHDCADGTVLFYCDDKEDVVLGLNDIDALLLDPRGEQSPPPPKPAPLEMIAHDHIDSSPFLEQLDLQEQLRECFIGENMGEAAICLMVGLLSERNVFLGGPPGTGKTSIVKALGDAIDVPFRKRLAGMETTSRDLFGPIDAKKYADGIAYERMAENTFSDAEMSFLDEGFKASKQALQLLLDYYEDGEIDNGSGRLQTPHSFGVIASNELAPKGSEALLDRFPIRCWGEATLNQNEEELLLRRSVGMTPRPTITARLAADDLEVLRRMVCDVRVSDEAFAAVQCWVEMARNGGVYISARQVTGLLPILRAYAFLSGSATVLPMHVAFLRFVGWSSHDQRKAVGQAATTAAKGIEKTVEYTL